MSTLVPFFALSLVLAAGCSSPVTPPGPALPNGPQAQALRLRASWAAFQDAVRERDRDALVALWTAGARSPSASGADGDELADAILLVVEDTAVLDAILAARAEDLRVDGQTRTFAFEQRSVDPEDGTEYESGVYIRFGIDPADGEVYLADVLFAG